MINLGTESQAFARGGNRLCFFDPSDSKRCIKVLRPDRDPLTKRAQRGFPRNLKPLRYFDDNREEFLVYQQIEKSVGESAFELIPRGFGFVDTNYGRGLVSEIITDSDDKISISLKQYVWTQGITDELNSALDRFKRRWSELGMPSRNLLLHNIVVQQDGGVIKRLVVIDGLGWSDLFPLAYWIPSIARKKAKRKVGRLPESINELIEKKTLGKDWGYHGWLDDSKREVPPN
ncbi:YrbL family protein [Sessilibacter corallicola]|uniref:YrbL family protein n=1 Tax=Sessilibacter corallicola TaxID=2904075 RepID=UPI001E2A0339|nr:YrbL family protein [Sessilibacter corallicola]MCE2028484.1 PhoP regulatory network YrbL family protein [Sessilibacter corallicola]